VDVPTEVDIPTEAISPTGKNPSDQAFPHDENETHTVVQVQTGHTQEDVQEGVQMGMSVVRSTREYRQGSDCRAVGRLV
jgi:hypothetical protein